MQKSPFFSVMSFTLLLVTILAGSAEADAVFDKLFSEKKFREAIDYADGKMAAADRDALTWIKIGEANNHLGMPEKALACFLVSWRMNPHDYHALLGASRAYNKMEQAENAMDMARKALEIDFTAEASWEYAQACIALSRPSEAKKAMEKVLQADSTNLIAVRELSDIYFHEGAWSSAVPLLKRSFLKSATGDLAFRIGKAYTELGVWDSAIVYLGRARKMGATAIETGKSLAGAFYGKKKYRECAEEYGALPENSLDAVDFYRYGVAFQHIRGSTDAVRYFLRAADLYGTSSSSDALRARENAARGLMEKKEFRKALDILVGVAAADPKATIIKDVHVLHAEAYQGLGDTENAIASLERAISVHSRHVEAYARLAELYQAGGKSEKAKKTFEVLVGLSPNDPRMYLALGDYNYKSKRYEEAFKHFEKSRTLKASAAAHEGSAKAAFELEKLDAARNQAQTALKMDGKRRDARLVLAKVHLKQKEYSAAQEQLEKLLHDDPLHPELLRNLAECYRKNKMEDKLAGIDTMIARLDGTDTAARFRLARYYESRNDPEKAVIWYRELTARTPGLPEPLRRLSLLYKKMGDSEEALSFTRKYLDIKGDDAEAHRDLGDLYYEKRKLNEALDEYRTALELNPAIKGFHRRYAEIVIAKGEQEEVIKALSGVIAAGNADAGTFMTLGLMYQKKKEYSKAIEMYQKALDLEPSNFDALTALAACQASNGEVHNAIVSYEQAVMMNSKASSELKELGDLYSAAYRGEEAIGAYRRYLAIDSGNVDLAQKVGSYLYDKNDDSGAVRYYGMARRKLDPGDAVKYAESSMRIGKTSDVLSVLLPLKPDKKIRGPIRIKIYKLLAQALENDSDLVAASQAYGDYVALEGVQDPDAAFRQGALIEKSDPPKAQSIYEANCKKYPGDYRNYLRLGLLLSDRVESLSKAVPLFQRVTELADSIPSVWLELGKIYGKLGKEDEELGAYRRYSEIDPQHVEANRRIGTILLRKERHGEGIVYLEIANTLQPNDPAVMAILAKGYMKTGRLEEAVALLDKAKTKTPEDPEIRFQLFELYQKSGQKQKARKEIEELVGMKREIRFLLLYAEALIIQDRIKEAGEIVEEMLAEDPENVDVLFIKGRLLRAQKRYDEAVEIYKEISFMDAENAPALLERAETHFEQSKPQWAESFYKRALRLDPSLGKAEFGLAKIAKLKKDMTEYHSRLENARRLNPDDEMIREELKKAGSR